jgi:hypothetical protein
MPAQKLAEHHSKAAEHQEHAAKHHHEVTRTLLMATFFWPNSIMPKQQCTAQSITRGVSHKSGGPDDGLRPICQR